MAFSIYIPIQIFFADPYLVHLQKYWHHLQQKILMYHLQKNFTVDAMLSVIEKHTTSFQSGISIKCSNFACFLRKPQCKNCCSWENSLISCNFCIEDSSTLNISFFYGALSLSLKSLCVRIRALSIKRPPPNKRLRFRVTFKVLMWVILVIGNCLRK